MIIWNRLYGKRRSGIRGDIRVGDLVRISKVKSTFEKGYLPNWTEEEFIVTKVDTKYYPTTYKLQDSNGDIIEGSFYRQEIQPISRTDDTYVIQRIIRRRRHGGTLWYRVKWVGYPDSANSWVKATDV